MAPYVHTPAIQGAVRPYFPCQATIHTLKLIHGVVQACWVQRPVIQACKRCREELCGVRQLRLLSRQGRPHVQAWAQEPSEQGVKEKPGTSGLQPEDTYAPGVHIALAVLRFYKGAISPLLPQSCRFLPTCSEYSQLAYKQFGFGKGSILTAWRLARCNPFRWGGYQGQYDPPKWPPVGLERMFP